MQEIFYYIAGGVETISFAIMIYGALIAILLFIKNEFGRFSGNYKLDALNKIRIDFGYYILLGLEFLIAADIIETILKPTSQELIELGGIVAIRIVLSYFLTKEITEMKSHVNQ
ncbi:MAG: DUF1622 domain-containing protein [Ignavibacteria bacterium]|nr:DUF1622 domain-containing protein [Ignavibacteria bacterium]